MKASVEELTVIDLPQFAEPRGVLVPVEFSKFVPFDVKRMFWIASVPKGGTRGGHAHKLCHQFAVCMAGRVVIEAFDGRTRRVLELAAGQALHIKPGIYSTERFIDAATVLSVLCDRPYEANDYLHEPGS